MFKSLIFNVIIACGTVFGATLATATTPNPENDNPAFETMENRDGILRGRINLNGRQLQQVSLFYAWAKNPNETLNQSKIKERQAELLRNNYLVAIPDTAPNRKTPYVVFYLMAVTSDGFKITSATTTMKVTRIVAAPPKVVPVKNNFFTDPSMEKQQDRGYNGKVYFNYSGQYVYDRTGAHALSGKGAVKLSGENQLMMQALGCLPGKKYLLSGHFKGDGTKSSVSLRINWMNKDKLIKTSIIVDQTPSDEYRLIKLEEVSPPGTDNAILFFNAENAWLDDLAFAPR